MCLRRLLVDPNGYTIKSCCMETKSSTRRCFFEGYVAGASDDVGDTAPLCIGKYIRHGSARCSCIKPKMASTATLPTFGAQDLCTSLTTYAKNCIVDWVALLSFKPDFYWQSSNPWTGTIVDERLTLTRASRGSSQESIGVAPPILDPGVCLVPGLFERGYVLPANGL